MNATAKPCPSSLDGQHRWTRADPVQGLYAPHCRCCEAEDGPPTASVKGPSWLGLCLALIGLGAVGYATILASHGNRSDEVREYAELKELDHQGDRYGGDWQNGAALIADDHFEDYAEELAEDLGMIEKAAEWPANCIDWKAAAGQLKVDYTAIEFRGKTFWVR